MMTLGSFFSGSGGFELAARYAGIETLWASEIEPVPIRVTRKNFPETVMYGDISKLDGARLPAVDIVSGGSPCQDMSIAGRREGLDGERSVLFRDYVRIVKEMRQRDRDEGRDTVQPRFMVWENVPGAFSSNKGEDFRCVLEEIAGIAEPGASIPKPGKGKWSKAGYIMGDGFSIAWRVMDAQFWGVPQRRKRIYLVADFGGQRAAEILFKREGLPWDSAKGGNQREDPADSAEAGIEAAGGAHENARCIEHHPQGSYATLPEDNIVQTLTAKMGMGGGNVPLILDDQGGKNLATFDDGTAPTLRAEMHNHPPLAIYGIGNGQANQTFDEELVGSLNCMHDQQAVAVPAAFGICSKASNAMQSDNPGSGFYEAKTSRTLDCHGGDPTCNQGGIVIVDAPTYAIQGNMIGREEKNGPQGSGVNEEVAFTLNTVDHHAVAYGIDRAAFNQGQNAQFGFAVEEDLMPTLVAKGPNAVAQAMPQYIVRRLTPLECCRLQGFPDDWADVQPQENPSASEVRFWMGVWAQHWKLVDSDKGVKLPKDEKAVRRWLKTKPTDSDIYRMWGNGIALPCATYVMEGIAEILKEDISDGRKHDRAVVSDVNG